MLGFLTRKRRKPTPFPVRRARLSVESLESRYCLSSTSLAIDAFNASVLAGHVAQLSGTVTDANPAGVTLSFSGAVSGTTTSDSSGHFSYSTTVATLGTVNAVATDQQGHSATAQATLSKAAPSITLSVSYGSGRTVTLSGTVTDLDAGGRTVTFTGVVSNTVNTRGDGTFSLTAQASGLGNVWASTVDLWGQSSNTASVTLTDDAPTIGNFQAVEGTNRVWTFSGTVTDGEGAGGLTVTFGGLPTLNGKTVNTAADGTFSLTIQLQVGENGTATAQTTDAWGQASNVAMANVHQTTPLSFQLQADIVLYALAASAGSNKV